MIFEFYSRMTDILNQETMIILKVKK